MPTNVSNTTVWSSVSCVGSETFADSSRQQPGPPHFESSDEDTHVAHDKQLEFTISSFLKSRKPLHELVDPKYLRLYTKATMSLSPITIPAKEPRHATVEHVEDYETIPSPSPTLTVSTIHSRHSSTSTSPTTITPAETTEDEDEDGTVEEVHTSGIAPPLHILLSRSDLQK